MNTMGVDDLSSQTSVMRMSTICLTQSDTLAMHGHYQVGGCCPILPAEPLKVSGSGDLEPAGRLTYTEHPKGV